jgi:catechol 2,3-dioxygenase-like lactoylglutathione lyase family enzyme
MPVIKVTDIAFGRVRVPDLDVMEEFLTSFGLTRADRTNNALYMRGTDPVHHIHVTEKGEPGFIGLAYHAASDDDLVRLAKSPGASAVEAIDEPGGGKRVRLREPNGYQIEVVHGMAAVPAIPVALDPLNTGSEPLRRAGKLMRLAQEPTPIKRIGHGVLGSPNVAETVRWFRETLGFIGSDDVYDGNEENLVGSFNRCDRGETFVDHHTLFVVRNKTAGLNHLSFEVHDIDAVFTNHEHLKRLGKYEHMWGVGRHLLGSQVYDYWCGPWDIVHERWADSDRLNAGNGSNLLRPEEAFRSQWGERPPERFLHHVTQ